MTAEETLKQELACLNEGVERIRCERLVNRLDAIKRHEEVVGMLKPLVAKIPQVGQVKLNKLERQIVEALGEDTLTGLEIAARLGRDDCDGHLKGTLSRMVVRGILGNKSPGYYVIRKSQD